MNRAVFRPRFRFELARVSNTVGLLAAVALLIVSMPQAEAQCVPNKRFTSKPGGPVTSLYIALPPDGSGNELGWMWQSDNSLVNNFAGGCPPTSWLHKSPVQAHVDGLIGAFDCTWNGCPLETLTLVLEDQSVDQQQAYLRVLRTPENLSGVFDFTCSPPPPHGNVFLSFPPFPGFDVLASTILPPTIYLTLEPDDLEENIHACPDPLPFPPWSTAESYDLYTFYGLTDPGRHRSFWNLVSHIPYTGGGALPVDVDLPCPLPGSSVFLALGVNFHGGGGGPVSSAFVGAGVIVADADGDGTNDCHDTCLDVDGDQYGSPGVSGDSCLGSDCDDGAGAVYPGAPQVCDGVNNDCDHAAWPALDNTTETDDDGDGLSEFQGDCDDGAGAVYPGAPQVCDGVNNDCDHADWPALDNTNELDDDGDGFSECGGDCDDADPNNWISCATCSDEDEDGVYIECDDYVTIEGPDNCPDDYNPAQIDNDLDGYGQPCDCDDTDPDTHPGAEEVNDGLDNQCPGDLGFGEIDETTGVSGFHDPDDDGVYSWPAQEGATEYEVARATRADFAEGCVLHATSEQRAETSWDDDVLPPPGGIFFYANRPIELHVGSWGADSTGGQRHFSCASYVWSFVDTNADDVASTSLYEFFDASPAGPSDYIRFWIYGWGWCAERADFYRESYLQLAPVGGMVFSGNWPKWDRVGASSPWVGPDMTFYPNQFGNTCWNLRPYGWSPERGLIEGIQLFINPDDPTFCEAEFIDQGCFATDMAAEVRIGGTFADVCDAPLP